MNTRLRRMATSCFMAVVSFAGLGCGGRARSPGLDSESHFLGECNVTCAPGLSCVCGVCTYSCTGVAECSAASSGAICRDFGAAQCGGEAASACDVGCSGDGDCAGISASARCSSGWCRVPSPDVALDRTPPLPENPVPVDVTPPTPEGSSAFSDCVVSDDTVMEDQRNLDALEGCGVIYGDLVISFAADLRPLYALRRVIGRLHISPPAGSGLGSLEGLENLERVEGGMSLASFEGTSLASLSRLTSVATEPRLSELTLIDCPNLQDLSGLQGVVDLRKLWVSGMPQLTSLNPLTLPRRMESLILDSNPRLTDIDAVRSVDQINTVILASTGLSSLGALTNFSRIYALQIASNPLLVDTSALAGLEVIETFSVTQNDRLQTLVAPAGAFNLGDALVEANAALVTISGMANVSTMRSLRVTANPLLGALSLPSLEAVESLEVSNNARLAALDLARLSGPVGSLVIVSNPALPPPLELSSFADNAKIGGNQGEAVGLDPCPWIRDFRCDEPPTTNLCAAGTDTSDCSLL